MSDELIVFAEEPQQQISSDANRSVRPWKVLVVDDDKDVHEATKFGLKGLVFMNQPLQLMHAYSADEARTLLAQTPDVAVVLLDVVMETESAGLDLVKVIRKDLEMTNCRIILRTGQPGYAPEIEVILKYDINDYKNKVDLTRTRLYTSVTAALRSYSEMVAIDTSRRGLEQIVRASSELMSRHGINDLANGIITQLSALLGIPEEGIICCRRKIDEGDENRFIIVAASGKHAVKAQNGSPLENPNIREMLQKAVREQRSIDDEHACVLYFPSEMREDILLYLDIHRPLEETEHQILEVFCSNISVCLDNATILDRLHNHAYFDSLLDIPNRISFANHIDKMLLGQTRNLMLTLIDIDHFSGINDTLGAQSGDELLRLVAQRLSDMLPAEVFISRVSGDTFGLLGPHTLLEPARIKASFFNPFSLFGDDLVISVTQGYYQLNDSNLSGNDAIKRANIALKRAKAVVRGEAVEYTQEIERETHQRMLLLQGLRRAYNENELFLAYQPQIDLRTGRVTGFEALMRWRTKNGTMIGPQEFIPVAESSGMIIPLGKWVMDTAMADLARLEQQFALKLQMGINISSLQFRHPNFLHTIRSRLDRLEVSPSQIEFEVTESVAMMDTENVREILATIHEYGAQVAIDDFGTGFSCLSYLETLKFDRLKIDKSFIDKMLDEHTCTHIPEMIIGLGKDLNMQVIAEGVETPDQLEHLKQLDCDQAQGFYFARPMEFSQLQKWLQQHLAEESQA